MIDPRLSLAVQGTNLSPAINAFENALMNTQTRELRAAEAARQAELQPLQLQAAQQQTELGQMQINQNREQQRLQNVHQTGQRLKPFLESGDVQGAQKFLLDNISAVQSRIEQGSGEDINESMEALARLQAGDVQGVLGDIGAIEGLVTGNRGASTKAFAPITDPNTGQVSIPTFDPNTGATKLVPVEGAVSETKSAQRAAEIESKRKEAKLKNKGKAVDLAIVKGGQAFDRLEPISVAISNYDEAISAIDAGAETGVVDQMLPSFKEASIKLDNIKKRLGLDVVGNTTFGALSESELKFALDSALPTSLQPAQLKEWLTAKRNAQMKVKERIEEAATFLSSGEHTLQDWIEYDKARQLNTSSPVAPQQQPPQQVAPQAPATSRYKIEVID